MAEENSINPGKTGPIHEEQKLSAADDFDDPEENQFQKSQKLLNREMRRIIGELNVVIEEIRAVNQRFETLDLQSLTEQILSYRKQLASVRRRLLIPGMIVAGVLSFINICLIIWLLAK